MLMFIVEEESSLDTYLRKKTKKGLRQIKELISEQRVVVNGTLCKKRKKILKIGDVIEILDLDIPTTSFAGKGKDIFITPQIIKGNDFIYGVYKPPFVHSTRGKSNPNMEDILEKFLMKRFFLLNRLDFLTSGILLFGLLENSKSIYLSMQDSGGIEKRYIALVHGYVEKEIIIKNKINHCKRKKVKVLDEEDKDSTRHTKIVPKKFFEKQNRTLVEAIILKGKRHQIRAHLSYMGHPILGDPLYGYSNFAMPRMYLHNFMVKGFNFNIKIKKEF
ncbi:hypothetical protein JCM13304A_12530 [Desulfothermus okinawensis JCM 13304]